ncbi:DUF2239 family protein [Rhizobium sp. RM]|uniref:DUF2239 family protein n=1 Tax=Rhizobium sp. RM TaxID=2748079 RepID=UPI00110DB236|nr:DUF2239 family protein [Rhizobium sp. RM]NWJ25892.1 DUF2239 family protein [Rhizobium sp. RM]TMV15826.1 DUF2239 family protein [Rhizobium sp. Td3]
MPDTQTKSCTAFSGHTMMAKGALADVAVALKRAGDATDSLLVFDDATGRIIDLDLRGSETEVVQRLRQMSQAPEISGEAQDQKGRGRPKLGVVAREVTLLPRQWEWLAAQPGGASAALRRLVDDARKATQPRQQKRLSQEAAYRFMHAMAGDLPGYEDATRALFADDLKALEGRIVTWPDDIRAYALQLACVPADATNGPSET